MLGVERLLNVICLGCIPSELSAFYHICDIVVRSSFSGICEATAFDVVVGELRLARQTVRDGTLPRLHHALYESHMSSLAKYLGLKSRS